MHPQQWTLSTIRQFETSTGLSLFCEPNRLADYNRDFGGLYQGQAAAVFQPCRLDAIQAFLRFTSRHKLSYTIRCHGLSQSGQSLARAGDVVVDVSRLNRHLQWHGDSISVGCSRSWQDLLQEALTHNRITPVFPYNTRLSIGGLLSAGGLGSASPRQGNCAGHVRSLQVLTADGSLQQCSYHENADLFAAVLSGTGQFGIIYEAEMDLIPAANQIFSRDMYFSDHKSWIDAQYALKDEVDYLEANCLFVNPADGKPLDTPRFRLSVASGVLPEDKVEGVGAKEYEPVQTVDIMDYVLRHEPRISTMMAKPYCDYYHPWFECFAPRELLYACLDEWIASYPRALGPMLHCFPVQRSQASLAPIPAAEEVMTLNILSPGVAPEHLAHCQQWLVALDDFLLQNGGKRYLSGWIPQAENNGYWPRHFGDQWPQWQASKELFDPQHLIGSRMLHFDNFKTETT